MYINSTYYVFVAGQDFDGTDGGGKARVGLASGSALSELTLHRNFLIEGTPGGKDERSVFPNGAVVYVAKNGTEMVAVTYMGQAMDDTWGGIFLATSALTVSLASFSTPAS